MPNVWATWAWLYIASLVGALGLTPYLWRLLRASGKPLKRSPRTLLLTAMAQNALLFAIVVAAGLAAARAAGLPGAPFVAALVQDSVRAGPAVEVLFWSAALGGALGLAVTAADLAFLPRLPAFLRLARSTSLLENACASFYGGVNEELLTRLLGVSGLVWLIDCLMQTPSHPPATASWISILAMALLFGVGHLPAARAVAGKITPLIVVRTIALNGPMGVACGWLFWRIGIEAAISAHFTGDMVYHVGGTALLRLNDRFRLFPSLSEGPPTGG